MIEGAQAAAGDLDPTFGIGGKVTTDFFNGFDFAEAVAIQSDGKIVAVGESSIDDLENFALARYNADGSLDLTFGSGGRVLTDFFGGRDLAVSVVVQPNGKIIVGGFVFRGGVFCNGFARYNIDGTLDPTFGPGGKLVLDIGGPAVNIALQANGKIVVVGASELPSTDSDFEIIRLNTDGSFDTSFGSGGRVSTDFSGHSFDRASDLAIQPDGKIIAAGTTSPTEDGITVLALARYNSDASLDTSFGSNGKVVGDLIEGRDILLGLDLQPDGKIIVLDVSLDEDRNPTEAVARYNVDGSLDTSFGSGGAFFIDVTSFVSRGIAIQPGGKIIIAGIIPDTDSSVRNMAVRRYSRDGNLDTAFGSNGTAVARFPEGSNTTYMALHTDGSIVLVGDTFNIKTKVDFILARFIGDAAGFDICLQDESNGNRLQINTDTGQYLFTDCQGLSSGGSTGLSRRGCSITFEHTSGTGRAMAKIDTCAKRGSASFQSFALHRTFTIVDRNTANNTCSCP